MNFGMRYKALHLISQGERLPKLERIKPKYAELVEPDFESDEDVIEEEPEEADESAFAEGVNHSQRLDIPVPYFAWAPTYSGGWNTERVPEFQW